MNAAEGPAPIPKDPMKKYVMLDQLIDLTVAKTLNNQMRANELELRLPYKALEACTESDLEQLAEIERFRKDARLWHLYGLMAQDYQQTLVEIHPDKKDAFLATRKESIGLLLERLLHGFQDAMAEGDNAAPKPEFGEKPLTLDDLFGTGSGGNP